nr:hypothetical protein [Piscirickettsia salmonis]
MLSTPWLAAYELSTECCTSDDGGRIHRCCVRSFYSKYHYELAQDQFLAREI